jgi:predicted GH43/DUF377 family glycosyl hydrolase
MRRSLAAIALAALCGCGRYADFSLPETSPTSDDWLRFSEHPEPVIRRDQSSDVLNPSVLKKDNEFWNFYSDYDGRIWRTALARSHDGVNWEKKGYVKSPDPQTWEGSYIAANGSSAALRGQLFHWYVAGPQSRPEIGFLRGEHVEPPVVTPGPRGSFDEMGVADPYVIRIEPYWYMYYLGQDRARRQQIGLARSADGVVWTKLRSNPVLAMDKPGGMDDRGLGEPAVWQSHGWYWMLFTGRDVHENRSLGLARSQDGVHWQRGPEVFHGSQPWDSKVLCDPTVLVDGDRIRVWFGGGDVASPDQNLHGQIGEGEMK